MPTLLSVLTLGVRTDSKVDKTAFLSLKLQLHHRQGQHGIELLHFDGRQWGHFINDT